MDIDEKRNTLECGEICRYVEALEWKPFPLELLGTGGLKSQQYPSDYDLFTQIGGRDRGADDEYLYKRLKRILTEGMKDSFMFFVELKIQNRDGSKKKFYEPTFSYGQFEDAVKTLDYIKLDYVVWVEDFGKLQELSVVYSFGDAPSNSELIKDIKADYEKYKKEGYKYKALKRLFSIARLTGNKGLMVVLSTLFNSHTGQLYSLLSNLQAILLLLERRPVEDDVGRFISVNLKDIEHRIGSQIEGMPDLQKEISSLMSQIGNETNEWIKKHNFSLP